MTAQHTPGPWWATNYGVRNSGGFICATTWPSRYPEQDERYAQETAQREADVCLMAAALDMREALREFDAAFTEFDPENRASRHRMRLAVIKARAAVAKATGKDHA